MAHTGSGKTGAFVLPILHTLLSAKRDKRTGDAQALFALSLSPTRELAVQTAAHFRSLGAGAGMKVATIIGGMDEAKQALEIAARPHVLVATPGRLLKLLANMRGFNLEAVRWLVLDEADKLLSDGFGEDVESIIRECKCVPCGHPFNGVRIGRGAGSVASLLPALLCCARVLLLTP